MQRQITKNKEPRTKQQTNIKNSYIHIGIYNNKPNTIKTKTKKKLRIKNNKKNKN